MSTRLLILASGAWLVLLALSIALSVLAAAHERLPGDLGIMTWAQDLPFPGESLSDVVRTLTETEVVLATGFAIALVLWLRGHRRQALLLAAGLALLPGLQAGLKEIVDRPRPDPALVDIRAGFDSPSFPSGHTLSGSFFYGFLLYLSLTLPLPSMPRRALALYSFFFLTMAGPVSVYLGVHWPSDVLGSWGYTLLLILPLIAADRTVRWP